MDEINKLTDPLEASLVKALFARACYGGSYISYPLFLMLYFYRFCGLFIVIKKTKST